jgi:DNA-binding transcriptional LysR family regulator
MVAAVKKSAVVTAWVFSAAIRVKIAAARHRAVDLELTVRLSGGLLQALDAGELDLVLAKRGPGKDRGRLMRREKLVWVGSDPALTEPDRPLPLILYPPPSISWATGLETLERAGRSWRIVCTSSSFSGLNAAARAGLGITIQGDGFVPAGLSELPPAATLPKLGQIEFVLAGPARTLPGPPVHWRRPFSIMLTGCREASPNARY